MRGPHYPAFLDLSGKRVLVVGGGPIAARKARELSRCGARVTVVAPEVCEAARACARRVVLRPFRDSDLDGSALVVSAASDERVNARVSRLCRRRGVWANVVDRPALCDFIAPSVLRRGPIAVAVSTGGACPGLARSLRLRLERHVTSKDARLARRLAVLRPKLLSLSMARRRKEIARLIARRA